VNIDAVAQQQCGIRQRRGSNRQLSARI